jgi:uncharacterized protein (DUF2141 family)
VTRSATLALLPLAVLLAGASPPEGATVTVTVTGLRNAKGLVRACMTADARDFPQCKAEKGLYATSVNASAGTVTFSFDGVKPGRYAISLLHDENSNGKIDRALGLMPKEGFGFSRDAKVRMGPPSFADAAFDLGTENRALTIHMRYMF